MMPVLEDLPAIHDLLAAVPVPPRAKLHLLACMAEPHRHYHGISHLDVLWRRHRSLWSFSGLDEALDRRIACAIAFHDSVFEFGAKDNEIRSAEFWLCASAESALSEAERSWVADTIVATADHDAARCDLRDPLARARQWLLDLDLSPLGENCDDFDTNVALLRAEAMSLTDDEWEISLRRSLQHFAGMQPLYRSDIIARLFSEPAKRNFDRQLRLSAQRCASMRS